ncbi:hypothetical protein Barb4_03926 [Bacteroidales bacterium Barb4]|nr:hypothetical protein Barb4_03926 [Bacteroidales bacterium Barb4]
MSPEKELPPTIPPSANLGIPAKRAITPAMAAAPIARLSGNGNVSFTHLMAAAMADV